MSWLSKALAKLKRKKNNEKVGETTAECPLKETGLLVMVMRGSNGEPFEGATVNIAGQGTGASHSKKTDNLKVALFKPIEPDTYDIDVTLPEEFADDYEAPRNRTTERPVRVVPHPHRQDGPVRRSEGQRVLVGSSGPKTTKIWTESRSR